MSYENRLKVFFVVGQGWLGIGVVVSFCSWLYDVSIADMRTGDDSSCGLLAHVVLRFEVFILCGYLLGIKEKLAGFCGSGSLRR